MGNPRGRPRKIRPATTLEGRENQLVSLASDLAEKQMREGTAAAAVITHYLKLGTTREKLEQERLQNENLLLSAKVDQIKSAAAQEAVYRDALAAMKKYTGNSSYEEEELEDYE